MRTTPIVTAVALALSSVACTPGQGPIHIRSVRPADPGAGCIASEEFSVSGFDFVDVAGDPEVPIWLEIGGNEDFTSATSQPPLIVNGRTLTSVNSRERVQVQTVLLRYRANPPFTGVTNTTDLTRQLSDEVPLTFVLDETTTRPIMQVPLFGRNLREKLAALPGDNAFFSNLTTTIELRGQLEPSQYPVRTPPVALPITIYKTEVRCPTAGDNRISKLETPMVSCSYIGLRRRFVDGDCCNKASPTEVDDRAGCDRVAR